MRLNRGSEIDAIDGVLEAGIFKIILEVTLGMYAFS